MIPIRRFVIPLALFLPLSVVASCAPVAETRFLADAASKDAIAVRRMRDVIVVRCAAPPKIDGSLDDPAWKRANAQGDFGLMREKAKRMILAVVGSLEAGPEGLLLAARPVVLRLLYDAVNLLKFC